MTVAETIAEFPKWVKCHLSHIVTHPDTGHVVVQGFDDFHIDRVSNDVTA